MGWDMASSLTFTTVATLPRSVGNVPFSHAWSAAVSGPVVRAATRETTVTLVLVPSGVARLMACWLGALAGRKELLLPCAALARDGSAFGITRAAAIQKMTIGQRKLTANRAIALKMSSACTGTEYRQGRVHRRTRPRL